MSLRVFSSGECGAWSVAIRSIVPSRERGPQRLLVARLAHRRIDADDAAEARVVVGRQHQIMRAGLAGDVDAARLGFAQRAQLLGRRDVQDVDARAGPFGEDRGAAHRLDRDHRGPRGEMRQRIGAAGLRACRVSRRSMMELVSACSEMRLPVGATTSKASSIAPVEGDGILPKVLPM